MQSVVSRLAAGARQVGIYRQCGRLCAVVLSLAASACANIGQLSSLSESPNVTIAFESVEGVPAPVFNRFMRTLTEEAGARQIAVVSPDAANYRLRGYLAVHGDGRASAVAWAWDVYDGEQRRAFRLNGEEKGAAGAGWDAADEDVLRKIARAGVKELTVFATAAAAKPSEVASTAAVSPAPKRSALFGWIDDWAPEASGIFRVFQRETKVEIVDAGIALPPPGEVPLPVSRPVPGMPAEGALAFAPE